MVPRNPNSKNQRKRAKKLEGLDATRAICVQQIGYLTDLSKTRLLDPHELKCLETNSKLLQSLKDAEAKEIISVRNEYSDLTDEQLTQMLKDLDNV